MAGYAYVAADDAARIKFESTADDAINRIETRLELHLSLLRATVALFKTGNGSVSRDAMRSFVSALDISDTYSGVRGLGYARLLRSGGERAVEDDLARNYGIKARVWPPDGERMRAAITLLEPLDDQNRVALGFDMMSEPVRRSAMFRAMETGQPRVTGRVSLLRGGDAPPRPGFLVYLPLVLGVADDASVGRRSAATAGFVYATFTADDLFGAALYKSPILPLTVDVYDQKQAPENLLYRSQAAPDTSIGDGFTTTRTVAFAGREWIVRFQPTTSFAWPTSRFAAVALGLFGLLLALALAYVVRSGEKAYEAIAALNTVGDKALLEKDLLLQEMKHRIKNSIARVLAISRQTASGSKSIEEFAASFGARLQAMSASQDMLTRSRWQKADLRELLETEIEQVLGQNMDRGKLTGPALEIDEATTQALGLTFHELATNALKYGATSSGDVALSVTWSQEIDQNGEPRLKIVWRERGAGKLSPPERKGFGTRLIDANVVRELGGSIDRRYPADGLDIEIVIPLKRSARRGGEELRTPR